jgi:hypothetical protein
LEEVGVLSRGTPPAFTRRLAQTGQAIDAVTGLIRHIANFLRELVYLVGWLFLLIGAVDLLIHPHLSLEHLAVPGAGALAVLQRLIEPWPRRGQETSSLDEPQLDVDLSLTGLDVTNGLEIQADQMTDL